MAKIGKSDVVPAAGDAVPSPRDHFRAMTRARILAGGRQCFEELGYAATKMDSIAKRVGLGRTALYQYFPSKADIMRQAILDDEHLFFDAFAFAYTRQNCDRPVLFDAVRQLFELYRREGRFLGCIREAAASDREVSNVLEGNFQSLVDRIAGQARLPPGTDRSRIRARVWMAIGATDVMFQRLLDERWELDEESALDEVARLWQRWSD
mgnify:FL=1